MKKSMTSSPASGASARSTYRHGDLHRALLESGVALARAGGPEAVVLREATRRAGVVPNAAYRHFGSRQELLQAVRAAAATGARGSSSCDVDGVHERMLVVVDDVHKYLGRP